MWKNYFKIAWRQLIKNKAFSFINIFGLSAGFTCCMLILLYIYHELSYDTYHDSIDRLYQLGTTYVSSGKSEHKPLTPAPMGDAMTREFPEIEGTTKLFMFNLLGEDKNLFQYSTTDGMIHSFYQTKGFLADSSFFKLFSYRFLEGNPLTALNHPNSVVISSEIAHQIFGNQSALNQVIHISSYINRDQNYLVTGVFKPGDLPSHIDGQFFISIYGGDIGQSIKENENNLATNNYYFTYLLLKRGADAKKLEAKFPAFMDSHAGSALKAAGLHKKQFLIPVKDIHLYSGMPEDVTPGGSLNYLKILGSIGLFILLIACVNFMNLSTARSSRRSAEIGVRKVLGAQRLSLVKQFLGESLLLSGIAFGLAIFITGLLLPLFENISAKNLALSASSGMVLLAFFLGLSLFTGLLAGSYPAFYLSSFKPAKILKGKFSNSFASLSLRRGLVIFQFFISGILIIASIVISRQMHFLRTVDLGFEKDEQIVIPIQTEEAIKIYSSLKNEVSKNQQVLSVAGCFYYPGIFPSSMNNLMHREGQSSADDQDVKMNWVDDQFLQTLQIRLLAGRLFSPSFPGDSLNRVIINEEAVRKLGFSSPQAAIGQRIFKEARGQTIGNQIIGVVKDFHFQDLHVPIAAYAFYLSNSPYYSFLIVHANQGKIGPILKSIESSWHRLNPAEPFVYSFLDEDFQKNYVSDKRLASLLTYFTLIAILISSLGLFGLASFSVEQRTKEIGIRKVLGAKVSAIVALLSKKFLTLVSIAILIASPVAWYIMDQWLLNFPYRINISWRILSIAAVISLTIAFITISFQVIKAAIANPVRSLRNE